MTLSATHKKWIQHHIQDVKTNVAMKPFTSFDIGGTAELLALPHTLEELNALVAYCNETEIPYSVMGGGTNLLISDNGISGVVIGTGKLASDIEWHVNAEKKTAEVTVWAGMKLQKLCQFAIQNGLGGLTSLIGIPGTVGGGVSMNAGTRDGCIGEYLSEVTIVGKNGDFTKIRKGQIFSGYRKFMLQGMGGLLTGPLLIAAVKFELPLMDTDILKKKATEFLKQRKATQPMSAKSAGCFFKNPPKESAGILIDRAGLKGFRMGGAMVSEKHANFIINEQNATAKDILDVAKTVRQTVGEKFGVWLEAEVQVLGV